MKLKQVVYVLDDPNWLGCEWVEATVIEVGVEYFVARSADGHTYIYAFENEGITWSEKNG